MFTIEPAALEDAGELLDIYDHYVRDTAISFEYEVLCVCFGCLF